LNLFFVREDDTPNPLKFVTRYQVFNKTFTGDQMQKMQAQFLSFISRVGLVKLDPNDIDTLTSSST
jgi:hypothetical protein